MNQLRVPTRRITVEVRTADGALAQGAMFHTETLYQTGGAEDIADELNDERSFVPFVAHDSEACDCLLNKRHIVRVRIAGPTEIRRPSAAGAPLSTLLFSDGSWLTGRLLLDAPSGASRLLDKFNQAATFLPFATEDGVEFVNRAHIVRVRSIDGGSGWPSSTS